MSRYVFRKSENFGEALQDQRIDGERSRLRRRLAKLTRGRIRYLHLREKERQQRRALQAEARL